MRFDEDRLGSDPTYMPGLDRSRRRWKCPKRYAQAGYRPRTFALPDDEALWPAICQEQTRAAIDWWRRTHDAPDPRTWGYVIWRYRRDSFSPYRDLKANTARGYDELIAYWQGVLGRAHVQETRFEAIRTIQKAMEDRHRSPDFQHRRWKMLRILASYAALLELPGARDTRAVLAAMRFRKPPPRSSSPTAEQVAAVVSVADARGNAPFALGLILQWTYALRAVDVRGQWLPLGGGPPSGILREGKRWADGLTWEMIDPDLAFFEKVVSKTARTMPEAAVFPIPDWLRPRFAAAVPELRTGPVVVSRLGRPYTETAWSRTWRRYACKAGVPDTVRMMDTRAGAITEAGRLLADPIAARNFAGHQNIGTTNRYLRGRDEDRAKIVELRGRRG